MPDIYDLEVSCAGDDYNTFPQKLNFIFCAFLPIKKSRFFYTVAMCFVGVPPSQEEIDALNEAVANKQILAYHWEKRK